MEKLNNSIVPGKLQSVAKNVCLTFQVFSTKSRNKITNLSDVEIVCILVTSLTFIRYLSALFRSSLPTFYARSSCIDGQEVVCRW